MRFVILSTLCLVLTTTVAWAGTGTIPSIRVEASFATEGPLSVFSSPSGEGHPFTEAFAPDGSVVDGTLAMTLFFESGGTSGPVANFPPEDIWLEGGGDMSACQGGTIPDAATDEAGVTQWTNPLRAGGWCDPGQGPPVTIIVNGTVPDQGDPYLEELRLNSADIDGDLHVTIADLQTFANDFYGDYRYRSDLRWDGVVNLSDVAAFATVLGTTCP